MSVVSTEQKKIIIFLFFLLSARFLLPATIGSVCNAESEVIQTDGKIIVAGYAIVDRVKNFLVARYAIDGTSDTTFDTDGVVTTLIGTRCRARSVAVQADGNIVVAGWSRESGQTKFALARYNGTDGSLDISFDTDGKVTTLIGAGSAAHAVAIQSGDQKIVVAGTAVVSGQALFVVARYNTNGALDTAGFGGGSGYTTTAIGSWARAHAIAIQADGKIVVAGTTRVSGTHQFAVARYTTAGVLDTLFDTDGIVTTGIGSSAAVHGVAIQTDGKVVVAGESDGNFALARYTTVGVLDTTFDTDGKVTTTIQSGARAKGQSVAIQSDGDIVVAGWVHKTRAHSHGDDAIIIARYTSAGALDTAFDTDGIVRTQVWDRARAHAVAIQSGDQFIVVAGWADNDVAVARYNTTGSLDTANFGSFVDAPVSDPGGITTLPAGSDVLPGAETFIWDEKNSGVDGGDFLLGTVGQKRDLSAIAGRQGNVSLDSINSQFTLQPGQYLIDVSAPAYRIKKHQIQLYNVTDAVAVKAGSSEYIKSKDAVTRSMLQYHFFAHKATTFEILHYASDVRSGNGFGRSVGGVDPEVYTQVKIVQIS